jgi:hypothetical protein
VVMGRDSGVEPLSVRPQTVMEAEVVGVELVNADGRASRRVPKKTRIRIGGARREWQLRRLYLTPISASTSRKNFDVDTASAAYFGQVLTRCFRGVNRSCYPPDCLCRILRNASANQSSPAIRQSRSSTVARLQLCK